MPSGQESSEIASIEFVVQLPQFTGGNKAHNVSARSSIVKTTGSVRDEPKVEHHLRVEKVHGSLQSYSSVVLGPRVGYPFA
jgi:hypothetical protein